jgi:uncharacterized protein YjbI with pentapeptide repeats
VGFLGDIFRSPRPQPKTIIKNVLGETMFEVPARDLVGSTCLRGKDLSHASLQSQWLDGADLEDVNLFGADLRNCSFARCNLKNANLAYAVVDGANFRMANLDGADLLHTNIERARLDGATITPASTIPGIFVCTGRTT